MSPKETIRKALLEGRSEYEGSKGPIPGYERWTAALDALDLLKEPKEVPGRKLRALHTYCGPRNKRGESRGRILKALGECPEGLTSTECGKAAGIARPTAVSLLGKLQKEGLVYQLPYQVGASSLWQLSATAKETP